MVFEKNEDVWRHCNDITDKEFRDEVRLACFAIVVEDIEKLYENEPGIKVEENKNYQTTEETEKSSVLISRLKFYDEKEITGATQLRSVLARYYKNDAMLTSEKMKSEYKAFRRSGGSSNYYKSEKEIEEIIEILREGALQQKELDESKYYVCRNIMYILYHQDRERFLKYTENLTHTCDRMARRRIKDIIGKLSGPRKEDFL